MSKPIEAVSHRDRLQTGRSEPHPLLKLITKVVDFVFSKLGLGLIGAIFGIGASFGVLHPLFFAGFALSSIVLLVHVIERQAKAKVESLAAKVEKMIQTGEVEDLWKSAIKAGIPWKQEHLKILQQIGKLGAPQQREKGLATSKTAAGVLVCLMKSRVPGAKTDQFLALSPNKASVLSDAKRMTKRMGRSLRVQQRGGKFALPPPSGGVLSPLHESPTRRRVAPQSASH
jgi:hypothetical protein